MVGSEVERWVINVIHDDSAVASSCVSQEQTSVNFLTWGVHQCRLYVVLIGFVSVAMNLFHSFS